MKDNTICAQGGVHGMVNKLSPIIGLKALNGKAELSASISNKINDMLMYIGFVLKRERPTIRRKNHPTKPSSRNNFSSKK